MVARPGQVRCLPLCVGLVCLMSAAFPTAHLFCKLQRCLAGLCGLEKVACSAPSAGPDSGRRQVEWLVVAGCAPEWAGLKFRQHSVKNISERQGRAQSYATPV